MSRGIVCNEEVRLCSISLVSQSQRVLIQTHEIAGKLLLDLLHFKNLLLFPEFIFKCAPLRCDCDVHIHYSRANHSRLRTPRGFKDHEQRKRRVVETRIRAR